jgi:hypothetical protein
LQLIAKVVAAVLTLPLLLICLFLVPWITIVGVSVMGPSDATDWAHDFVGDLLRRWIRGT